MWWRLFRSIMNVKEHESKTNDLSPVVHMVEQNYKIPYWL